MLCHVTSLPGTNAHGKVSHAAYRFVEWLVQAGFSIWQVLPLNHTHEDGSPYHALSAHACDPKLICLDWLSDRNYVTAAEISKHTHTESLQIAYRQFLKLNDKALLDDYRQFVQQQAYWLADYSLFMSIRQVQNNKPWIQWPAALRDREADTLKQFRQDHKQDIAFHDFCQFIIFSQWQGLKTFANQHGVLLFGDAPIFVSHDSADVWANRRFFDLDKNGKQNFVAGVPPDYFSADGQRWGNPLYDWSAMQTDNFGWWKDRFQTQAVLFDILRIDHFRGLAAFWQIPATNKTARQGKWVNAPGAELLQELMQAGNSLTLVAEDLGIITDEVHALREKFSIPGMKVLQFAFDGDPENIYLPHNHRSDFIVYTGTHDNDTTVSWYNALADHDKAYVQTYLGFAGDEKMPWPLIRAALASVANTAIIPLQDLLELGHEHRMNTPGTTTGNWSWRFDWQQIPEQLAARVWSMNKIYNRL